MVFVSFVVATANEYIPGDEDGDGDVFSDPKEKGENGRSSDLKEPTRSFLGCLVEYNDDDDDVASPPPPPPTAIPDADA